MMMNVCVKLVEWLWVYVADLYEGNACEWQLDMLMNVCGMNVWMMADCVLIGVYLCVLVS